ncbi:RDD family protein [Nocardia carnea]|uniref:RDD family protein n=1 Tax=Nocardia carnea TaxID=37328 RepID=UPI002458A3B8|nr:RDD family protein [Nocardia carnea]
MARVTGSWLTGPSEGSGDPEASEYPGEHIGLPRNGAGSLVGLPRRIVALLVDWVISIGIAALIVRPDPQRIIAESDPPPGVAEPTAFEAVSAALSTPTWLVWMAIGIVAVALFGFTPGQYFLRLRVIRVDIPARVGFLRALGRQVLLTFVVPALFTDGDGRGMHDRATGTAVVRIR